MIPPTYLVRCTDYGRKSFALSLFSLFPNRFMGHAREINQLIRDFACVDGMQWESYAKAPEDTPYYLRSAHTRDPGVGEAQNITNELLQRFAQTAAPYLIEAWKTVMDRSIADYPLAPDSLDDQTKKSPAYLWAYRVVILHLEPNPHRVLMEFKSRQWWYSWA